MTAHVGLLGVVLTSLADLLCSDPPALIIHQALGLDTQSLAAVVCSAVPTCPRECWSDHPVCSLVSRRLGEVPACSDWHCPGIGRRTLPSIIGRAILPGPVLARFEGEV